MQRLLELDRQLSILFQNFNKVAQELPMIEICDLSDEITISQQKYAGIYRIDVSTEDSSMDASTWIQELRAEWEHSDFLRKHTPNFKNKRIVQHQYLREWMPLYLGKSESVGKRVLEHLNLRLEQTTFALKLKARPGMSRRKFRLYTLELPIQNYNLLAPVVESALRDHFHPLVGKQ